MGSVEVYILGQKYVVKGDESPEYIRELAELVDRKLKEVYAGSPHITPLKASILAALTLADELQKVKREYNAVAQNLKTIEDKADTIIRLFD
ncbi:MAG: cell division protein ZapA [Nitrospirota bacterium]